MTRTRILIVLLTLCFSCALAQTKQITLQEALNLAVANSNELKISKANLEIAQSKVAQAKDQAWPELKASATYLRINTPDVKLSSTGESGGGGGSSPGPLAAFANLHSIGLAQLTLSEPIFAGFRIRNSRIMQEYLQEAATYDESTTRSKVMVNTTKVVFQYYQLLETQKLMDENLKQAQQRVTEFTNREQQGLLARNDRLKAELQANNIQLARTEVNNNLLLAEYNLHILLGIPETTVISLDTTGMFKSAAFDTQENYEQAGLEKRTELKSAKVKIEAGKTGTRIAKASRYPTLGLSAGYVNAYIPNVVTVNNALNAGIALQYNLTGALHSKHLIQEAKAREHTAELSAQMLNDQVKLDIRRKFLNYQKSLEKINLSQQAIEQAQENFSISKNKYNAGLMILSDYLDADVTLLQTRINFATARAESMIAYYELQESTGNIE